jgi:hypothetical protein
MLALVLMLFVWPGAVRSHAAGPCLSFEPAVETIVGTLVRRTFPGPPNYQSIRDGDAPETGWYVRLTTPLCFSGTPGDEVNGKDVAGVTLVQLVFTHDEYRTRAALVARRVTATGTFFTAQTGHHHTPVLLLVGKLEPAP